MRGSGTAEARNDSVGSVARNLRVNVARAVPPLGHVALSPEVLAVLTLNIEMRHVIGHNLRVADAAFAERADARLGETVPLVGADILQFAEIGGMVVNGIDAWLVHHRPSKIRRPTGRGAACKGAYCHEDWRVGTARGQNWAMDR